MRRRLTSGVVFGIAFCALVLAACAPAPAPPRAEDDPWCAEHGVPESACTICHPELAAAFQAKGDWCAEHGLPESVCPICRGTAPAAGSDGPPADGTVVRLRGDDTAARAGIETAPAEASVGDGAEIEAPARIVPSPRHVARVHAPLPGLVREVLVSPGDRVARGRPLARLDSADAGAASAALHAARSRLDTAEAAYARSRSLYAEGIVPDSERLAAKRDRDEAEADLEAARAALGLVGGEGDPRGRFELTAPIAGIVVRVFASPGLAVDHEEALVELVDTAEVVLEIEVGERDLPRIAIGAPFRLTIEALPGHAWHGSIESIAPEVDLATRTTLARARLRNPDGALRPGAWGRARIRVATPEDAAASVPRESVQDARGVPVVFVESRPGLYETRHVVPVGLSDGRVRIARGVRPGERVVTAGAFLLKTETLRGAIGAGCCE